MDAGGGPFVPDFFGVGPDGVGGSADDTDLAVDVFRPLEEFTGLEDTVNRTAFGLPASAADTPVAGRLVSEADRGQGRSSKSCTQRPSKPPFAGVCQSPGSQVPFSRWSALSTAPVWTKKSCWRQ
jgi:hypothetical protein